MADIRRGPENLIFPGEVHVILRSGTELSISARACCQEDGDGSIMDRVLSGEELAVMVDAINDLHAQKRSR